METTELQKQILRITGMTCTNCRDRIEKKLKSTTGIEDASVNYETGTASVDYDASLISLDEIKAAVESLGYRAEENSVSFKSRRALQIAGTLVIIIALYMLLHSFSTSSIAAAFPTAREGMSYGMLFIIGLLTSVHCIGMCGGINLSQTLRGDRGLVIRKSVVFIPNTLLPGVLYNGGRLLSYTAVGFVVGALGSVITMSGRFQGVVALAAGVFMLIMGINMLGLFPALTRFVPHIPKIFPRKIDERKTGKGPAVVGFLNGFMPCGPLQAMQIYALSTGSPARGALSMFLFCLGTIPLMFALGAAGGILSGAKGQVFSRRVMQVGAVLVAAMGLAMFANGLGLAGFGNPLAQTFSGIASPGAEGDGLPLLRNGVQIINSTLLPNRYPAIAVQQGIPVHWIINAPPGSINGCNNRFIIREYGIEHTFTQGDNVIEFLPEKTGRVSYSCWMGMIRSSITVVAEGESLAAVLTPDITPKPAGVELPTDEIGFAEIVTQIGGRYQVAGIRLGDAGFEPAVVVMERRLPALWIISVESPDPGNNLLVFPAYYARVETIQGENQIQLMPLADFDFSTGDHIFYGYVKVVDDIEMADIGAIKAELAGYETMMYPDAYFEEGPQEY